MTRSITTAAVVLLAACATTPAAGRAPLSRDAEPIESQLAVATFDSAWSTISRTYYDSTFRGLDWPGVRRELRPRAAAAGTVGELRATIRSMLARMGESHFGLIPAEIAKATGDTDEDASDADAVAGDVGIEVRIVEGAPLVWRIDLAGPAFAAGVRTGWIISEVDGFSAAPALAAAAALPDPRARNEALRLAGARLRGRFGGDSGSIVPASFVDGSGRARGLRITRRREPGEIARFGNLPPLNVLLTHSRIQAPPGCIGYIRFNLWLTPVGPAFDRAMQALSDCRGIVLDLRGNPGGIAGLSMGVAGYFVDSVVPLGILRTRSNDLRLVTNPRRVSLTGAPIRIYAGRVAILVDGESVSTSEIFAAGMQYLRRATVFGDTTSGQALPALTRRLPNGDVLMHVFSDYTLPDGTRLEVRGVIPDIVQPVTRADLLAGRDAALLAAVNWLNGSR
ncbi:MAG: S41 family peptidase [Gemmatimonadaceae bacterium]